jgi:hypothetical protein
MYNWNFHNGEKFLRSCKAVFPVTPSQAAFRVNILPPASELKENKMLLTAYQNTGRHGT